MKSSVLGSLALILLSVAIAGCGGGGGSSTPQASVTASATASKVTLGQSTTISWSSNNATSCAASGAWSGTQATSGSVTVTPPSAGTNSYTIACSGAGATATQTVTIVVPVPVQASSYLNAKNLNIASYSLPAYAQGYGIADFFQNGSYSLVLGTFGQDSVSAGKIRFYKRDASGAWADNTASLLNDDTGCITARKVVVADFNNDGKPDVFFACHGIDGTIPSGYTAGEHPRILLSQPDGTYSNIQMPFICYCHGASAADVNGNGFADLIVTDTAIAKQPIYLVNNHDGSFTQDLTRFNAALSPWVITLGDTTTYARPISNVELIQFSGNGKFDAFFSGGETPCCVGQPLSGFKTTIYPNDGTNHFSSTTPLELPSDTTYPNVLDIVFIGTKIYLLRVNADYTANAIQAIDYPGLTSSIVYSHSGAYPSGSSAWYPWIMPYNGNIVSVDNFYGVTLPQ